MSNGQKPPPNQGRAFLNLHAYLYAVSEGKSLLFLAFWNNGKLHSKFSPIFLTKNSFLKNKGKLLLKIYLTFLPKICLPKTMWNHYQKFTLLFLPKNQCVKPPPPYCFFFSWLILNVAPDVDSFLFFKGWLILILD